MPDFYLYDEATGLPVPWVTLDKSLGAFFIFTSNQNAVGNYNLVCIVGSSGHMTADPVPVVYRVNIKACS